MKRYYVSVTEHLNKVVSVDAESEEEAVNAVQDAYNNCDIVLDSDNFVGDTMVHIVGSPFVKITERIFQGILVRPHSGGEFIATEVFF